MMKNAEAGWLNPGAAKAVEIIEGVVVDKPDSVEVTVEMYSGVKVSFSEIIKYVSTAVNTCFYVSSNLDTSFDAESNYSYLWIDTGYKDISKVPVFMMFKKEGEVYKYVETAIVRSLADKLKKLRPKNAGLIDKNYQKFIKKYREDAVSRGMAKADIKTDKKPQKEKVVIDIEESSDGPSTMAEAMAAALKKSGVKW